MTDTTRPLLVKAASDGRAFTVRQVDADGAQRSITATAGWVSCSAT